MELQTTAKDLPGPYHEELNPADVSGKSVGNQRQPIFDGTNDPDMRDHCLSFVPDQTKVDEIMNLPQEAIDRAIVSLQQKKQRLAKKGGVIKKPHKNMFNLCKTCNSQLIDKSSHRYWKRMKFCVRNPEGITYEVFSENNPDGLPYRIWYNAFMKKQ